MYRIFLGLCATFMLCLSACSDDKEYLPEDADENFITSVVLTVDETTYKASIENHIITITVPYTVTLKDAKAQFTYTASATIMPDPETITDWDTERTFRVTSYNGEANEYTYQVVKDEIRHEGDAVLETDADVAAFVASDVTIVKGNLVIGSDAANAEPLTDISALTLIKEVEGNIIIRNSYQGADLKGLDNIARAGGLMIGNEKAYSATPELQMITMKSLREVSGDIVMMNNEIVYVLFENLTTVEGSIQFNSSSLQSFDFPVLAETGGDLIVEGLDKEEQAAGTITELTFPELTTVEGKLSVNYFIYLSSISFPALHTAGSIELETIPVILETLSFPEIREVNGDFLLVANHVKGDFATSTYNHMLTEITGLDKLTTVKGMLTVAKFQSLATLPDVSHITTLGGLTLHWLEDCHGQELDLSHINFEKFNEVDPSINITGYTNLSKIITQEDLSHVDITLHTQGRTAANYALFPEMNFKSVKDYSNTNADTTDPVYTFEKVYGNLTLTRSTSRKGVSAPNLTYVGGYMSVNSSMTINVDFPELETVGGQLYVSGSTSPTGATVNFSKLRSVCYENPVYVQEGDATNGTPVGALDIRVNNLNLVFPELERVGGVGFTVHAAKWISCPRLTAIDGTLCVEAATQITKVDMPALTTLTGVYFSSLNRFVDFTDFGKFIKNGSITEANWTVKGCGYNPTYQDMVDEKYTQQ